MVNHKSSTKRKKSKRKSRKSIIQKFTRNQKESSSDIQSIQIIGTRDYQEDQYFIKSIPKHIIVAGIFDGHGGGSCSKWVNKMFQRIILKTLDTLHKSSYKVLLNKMLGLQKFRTSKNLELLLKSLNINNHDFGKITNIMKEPLPLFDKLKKLNDYLYEDLLKKSLQKISDGWDKISIPNIQDKRNKYTCGTTALITLVVGHTVHIIWIGDSRTVWKVDNNKSVYSTKDHKPDKNDLLEGAFIKNGRINGVLAVGRAIGDNGMKTKGALKRTPSYISYEYKKNTEIVMGSDGVYDKLSSNHTVFEPSFIEKINQQKKGKLGFFTDNTTMIKICLKT